MSNKNDNKSNGIGFTGFLTLLFITLKLLGKISWSWWWVYSPLWIPIVILLILSIIIIFLEGILAINEKNN